MRSPEPAASAAGAKTTNTPVPIIAPSPISTASASPSRRSSFGGPVGPGSSGSEDGRSLTDRARAQRWRR